MIAPIRQGDVLFVPIDSLPKGDVQKSKSLTVAIGEATGHHHTLYSKKPLSYVKADNYYFVKMDVDTPLQHQEHGEIVIPMGTWVVGFEVERDPFKETMKRVAD